MLDSLGFQIPQMEVISSDPRNVFQGESQLDLQKGQTQAKRIQEFQNFVGQAFAAGTQVAKPLIAKERAEREQKGIIAGLEAAAGVSGTTYQERSENLKAAFKGLRESGDIGLIDDPYFVRGLQKAKGQSFVSVFELGMEEVYERAKGNPDFYNDPSIFQSELKRVFDSVYVSLPQNSDIQEGFLSKISPFVDKANQKFVAEANEFQRVQYLNAQGARVGASLHTFNTYKDLITNGNEADARDRWIDFGKTLLLDFENGDVSQEELSKYIPERFKEEDGTYSRGGVEAYAREVLLDPEAMKAGLINGAYEDLVEEIQAVYDELYSFGGEGRGGLKKDPTDAIVEIINSQFTSPTTARQVLSNLRSGTGLLMETDKGKAALNALYEKSLSEQRAIRQRVLSERNQGAAEFFRNRALEVELLDADISTFAQILMANQSEGKGPQTAEDLARVLEERLEFIKDVDPAGYAKRLGTLREAVNRSKSPYSNYSDAGKRARTAEHVGSIFDKVIQGGNVSVAARDIISSRNAYSTGTDDTLEGLVRNSWGGFQAATFERDVSEEDKEEVTTRFWTTASLLKEIQEMGGPTYGIDPSFGSESVVKESLFHMQTLAQANELGLLEVFVDPDSTIGQTIQELKGADYTSETYPTAFIKAYDARVEREEKARAEKEQKEVLGFAPDAIPFPKAKQGGAGWTTDKISGRDLFTNAYPGIRNTTSVDDLPIPLVYYPIEGYSTDYNQAKAQLKTDAQAAIEANKKLRERFDNITVTGRKEKGFWWWSDDYDSAAISLVVNNDQNHLAYLQALQSDETTRHKGIRDFLFGLQEGSTENSFSVAEARVERFKQELTSEVLTKMAAKEAEDYIPPVFHKKMASDTLGKAVPAAEEFELQGPAFEKAFNEAFAIYENSVDSNYRAFESREHLDTFVSDIANSYIRISGNGDLKEVTKRVEKLLFKSHPGFAHFDPVSQHESWTKQTEQIRKRIERTGVESFLGLMLSDEAIENFTEARKVAEYMEKTRLNFDGFEVDNPDVSLSIIPMDDYNFVVVNQNGKMLTYKESGTPFTLTIEDLGDAVQTQQQRSPQAIWAEVGHVVNPKVESVTDEEFMLQMYDYFEPYPSSLNLSFFVQQYKGYGMDMYRYYKHIKNNPREE